jgi:hypothetical protein
MITPRVECIRHLLPRNSAAYWRLCIPPNAHATRQSPVFPARAVGIARVWHTPTERGSRERLHLDAPPRRYRVDGGRAAHRSRRTEAERRRPRAGEGGRAPTRRSSVCAGPRQPPATGSRDLRPSRLRSASQARQVVASSSATESFSGRWRRGGSVNPSRWDRTYPSTQRRSRFSSERMVALSCAPGTTGPSCPIEPPRTRGSCAPVRFTSSRRLPVGAGLCSSLNDR